MKTVTCQEVRRALNERIEGTLSLQDAASLLAHADRCPQCQARLAGEPLLRLRLRTLPAPVPPPGFEQRTRARLLAARRPQTRQPTFALAASLAFGVGLALLLARGPLFVGSTGDAQEVARADAVSGEVQPLRLVFNSARALSGVTLSLAFPEGVELAARPGVRELSWQTDLQRGANVLELPLRVHGAGAGVVIARLQYGNAQREYLVALRTSQKSGFLPDHRAAGDLAAARLPASLQNTGEKRHA